MAPIESAYATS